MARAAVLAAAVAAALVAATSGQLFKDEGGRTGVCVAWGDVHMITFENQRFDAMGSGNWVLTRTKDEFFEVQARQAPWVQNKEHVTVAKDVAVKCGTDIVELQTDGGLPRGGPVTMELLVNGLELKLAKGEERELAGAASHPKAEGKAKVFKLEMLRRDGNGMHLRLDCNARGGDDTPGGFMVELSSTVMAGGVFTNTMIRADQANPKCKCEEQMDGLCGWTPDDMDAQWESNKCTSNSFMSEACKKLVTVDSERSLFKDKKWHAARASVTPITVDPAKLREAQEKCKKVVDDIVPDGAELPDEVKTRMKAMEKNCAFDTLYGLPPKVEGMRDLVCDYGTTKMDALRRELAKAFRAMRCSFTYDAALKLSAETNMEDVAMKHMETINGLTSEIRGFCFDGCKCEPAEGDDESPSAAPCGK